MSLYSVIVVGVLALVSLATLIGAAQGFGNRRGTGSAAEERRSLAGEWAELAKAKRVLAIERALAAAERAEQCLPPRPRRCPWCGGPVPPDR